MNIKVNGVMAGSKEELNRKVQKLLQIGWRLHGKPLGKNGFYIQILIWNLSSVSDSNPK